MTSWLVLDDRASDPWATISPNGAAYQIALGLNGVANGDAAVSAVLVSRSADGGLSWGAPTIIAQHNNPIDDKVTITADPNDSRYVYAIWDRTVGNATSTLFSRTIDDGMTWEPARVIYNPGNGGYAGGHQIVVLSSGALADIFLWNRSVAALLSTDHGESWSPPVLISPNQAITVVDPNTQRGIRSGGFSSAAADPNSGAIYAVWADARFSGQQRDGIALAKSLDGGLTWSQPGQVNQAQNVQAFMPAVAVSSDGRVAVTYFDFRNDAGAPGTLLARCWKVVSHDGGSTWGETPVSGQSQVRSTC